MFVILYIIPVDQSKAYKGTFMPLLFYWGSVVGTNILQEACHGVLRQIIENLTITIQSAHTCVFRFIYNR